MAKATRSKALPAGGFVRRYRAKWLAGRLIHHLRWPLSVKDRRLRHLATVIGKVGNLDLRLDALAILFETARLLGGYASLKMERRLVKIATAVNRSRRQFVQQSKTLVDSVSTSHACDCLARFAALQAART
jgi:hypothetical protein